MNGVIKIVFGAAISLSLVCQADTVVKEVPDTTPGKSFGGVTGLMVGSVGGPLGAVAGAGIGLLSGGKIQALLGLSGRAYEVESEDGSRRTVRSPNQQWESGDKVQVVGRRLVTDAATDS
jgi:hypothetical protein